MGDDVRKEDKKLTAYERWELPCLQDENKKTEVPHSGLLIKTEATVTYEEIDEDELVYEPLTASQLEEIRSAAYEEGFAQGLVEGTREGIEQGRVEGLELGKEEGFGIGQKEGFELGHSEAKEQANTQFQQIEIQLKTLLDELISPLRSTRSAVEKTLYSTIKRLINNIVQLEVSNYATEILKSQLNFIFDSIEDYEGKIKLSLNPKDIELLDDYQIFKGFNLHLEPLETLMSGGFILESKNFFVDGSIDNRMEKIFTELEQLVEQIDMDEKEVNERPVNLANQDDIITPLNEKSDVDSNDSD
ncbi:FliH/SctL family protein [Marinomonas sp. 15G1-11]|uniref:Flagellar assembly protein FliH n=1 Tax=Marinomonas phaeophyticola TaxID=3004091 RepID=A0ABT4JY09_9GAMM|nr:FliH/SctL family protein [Marinomonas sp. 15G1-11]MCZ2723291.1 FliH/SctL family protein [Marinomonas sp. 15G1-11]